MNNEKQVSAETAIAQRASERIYKECLRKGQKGSGFILDFDHEDARKIILEAAAAIQGGDGQAGYIVELERGVWLCDGEGDPSRTLVKESAAFYGTVAGAQRMLEHARTYRPFKNAKVIHYTPPADEIRAKPNEMSGATLKQRLFGVLVPSLNAITGELSDDTLVAMVQQRMDELETANLAITANKNAGAEWKNKYNDAIAELTAVRAALGKSIDRELVQAKIIAEREAELGELKAHLHPVALTQQQEQIEFQRLRLMNAKQLFEEVNLWRLRYECLHMEADKAEAKLAEQSAALDMAKAALTAAECHLRDGIMNDQIGDSYVCGVADTINCKLAQIEALAGKPSLGNE